MRSQRPEEDIRLVIKSGAVSERWSTYPFYSSVTIFERRWEQVFRCQPSADLDVTLSYLR